MWDHVEVWCHLVRALKERKNFQRKEGRKEGRRTGQERKGKARKGKGRERERERDVGSYMWLPEAKVCKRNAKAQLVDVFHTRQIGCLHGGLVSLQRRELATLWRHGSSR